MKASTGKSIWESWFYYSFLGFPHAVLIFLILPLALGAGRPGSMPAAALFCIGRARLHHGGDRLHSALRSVPGTSYLRADRGDLSAVALQRRGQSFARVWLPRPESGWLPLLLVIVTLLADVFFLPSRLAALVGMDFGYRLFVSGVLLVPLGFVMGMPFPTGLRAFAALPAPEYPAGTNAADNAVEWAWAMNAAASVLGSVLAMVIAIQFGLTVTLVCGTCAYLLALVLMPALRPKAA